MGLSEDLRLICNESLANQQKKAEEEQQRLQEEQARRIKEYFDMITAELIKQAERGRSSLIIRKPLHTQAEHWAPGVSCQENVCRPEQLLGDDKVIYEECQQRGLSVKIDYYCDRPCDEDGYGYRGGYQLVAYW